MRAQEIGIYPVILSGGAGTRLWPLSRRALPKQFAVQYEGKSLLESAFRRGLAYPFVRKTICVTHYDYRFLTQAIVEECVPDCTLLLEPESKNTAPTIAVAALHILQRHDPHGVMVCMPSDHIVDCGNEFVKTVTEAASLAAEGWIVIIGVKPDHPSESYGYILPGRQLNSRSRVVAGFKEKPNSQAAAVLIGDGCLWNCGMVVARADVLVNAFIRHSPALINACRGALQNSVREFGRYVLSAEHFSECEPISFDHAILEKVSSAAVVELTSRWNDVGTWAELAKLYPANEKHNRISGEGYLESCQNTFISSSRFVVGLGLKNILVAETPDAILVADLSQLKLLKETVAKLADEGRPEVSYHTKVWRPWGSFQVLDSGKNFRVKRITVRPGGLLSLQYHQHRSEHWTVVSGSALVTCGEKQFALARNESTYIAKGAVHRLENLTSEPLELIEVQSGEYLGEDDITRMEDVYGREKKVAGD